MKKRELGLKNFIKQTSGGSVPSTRKRPENGSSETWNHQTSSTASTSQTRITPAPVNINKRRTLKTTGCGPNQKERNLHQRKQNPHQKLEEKRSPRKRQPPKHQTQQNSALRSHRSRRQSQSFSLLLYPSLPHRTKLSMVAS